MRIARSAGSEPSIFGTRVTLDKDELHDAAPHPSDYRHARRLCLLRKHLPLTDGRGAVPHALDARGLSGASLSMGTLELQGERASKNAIEVMRARALISHGTAHRA